MVEKSSGSCCNAVVIDRFLRSRLGVDPYDDHVALCDLATTGWVVSAWRNTFLEDIHTGLAVRTARPGSYARDGIPDADMARLNIATWRQVRPHVTPEQMDVIAVRDLLRDKNRPLLLGDQQFAAGALFAGAWTKLVWHLNEGAWLPLAVTHTFGGDERATVRYYAACGGSFAMRWFGNPWWSTAIMAWADANPPPTPGDIALAVEAANELDERGIVWLIEGTYSTQFLDAIHQWQRAHGADDKQQAALGLFPPGVPELPASMTTQQPSSP